MSIKIYQRPKVSLILNARERSLEIYAFVLLVIYWGNIWYFYSIIPEDIPVHFDTKFNPDAYANKNQLFRSPELATGFYIMLSLVGLFPRYFNYLTDITPENAESEYRKAANMMRYLKIIIILIFMALSALKLFHTTEIKDRIFYAFIISLLFLISVLIRLNLNKTGK